MKPAADPGRVSLPEKLAYGAGDFASCLYWAAFGSFLLKFYTDVFGIAGAAAGTLFLFARIWDGVNDPLLGAIADRTRTRWGQFRPYLLFGAVPFAIAGVLLFTTPDLDTQGKIVWAWITYNLMMMLYTAVNIPYTALLGTISSSSIERTSISSVKFLFAFGAGLVVKATLPFLTEALGGGDLRRGYELTFVIYGAVAAALFFVTFAFTRQRVTPPPAQRTRLLRDLGDLVTNGPWLVLLASTVPFILFVAIRGTITAHYIDYYVGEQTTWLPGFGAGTWGYKELFAVFGVAGDVGSILGVLLVTAVARRLGKKTTFLALMSCSILATLAFRWLRPDQIWIMLALQFVGSMTGGPLSVILWAMYADCAYYSGCKRGRLATGLVFSSSTMSQKFGWAVGGFYAGKLLSATGYVPNAEQPAEVLDAMRAMMGVTPAAFGLVALLVIAVFPLTERRIAQLEAELAARRGAGAGGAAGGAAPA
ncbi:MAG TPA: MFS transporter [Polyangiaceae bacterium]|nr:MFS transporter [Polyangiaceae bacterium]